MNWRAFAISLVQALAWPVVVVAGLILFKRQLNGILGRGIKYLKAGPFEAGFDEQAKVAGSIIKRAEIEAETPGFKTPQSPTEYLAAIRAVVLPIDPLVAVKMAGALAEAVLDEIAMPHIPKENGWAGSSEPIEAARRGGVISPVGVLAFHKLRELRYVLLDNTTKKVVPEEATEYLDLVSDALSLVERQYAIALARSMS